MYRKHTARVIYRLVLAHEGYSNALCQLPENAVRGVDMVPYAGVGQRRLSNREFLLCRRYLMAKIRTFPIACDMA